MFGCQKMSLLSFSGEHDDFLPDLPDVCAKQVPNANPQDDVMVIQVMTMCLLEIDEEAV